MLLLLRLVINAVALLVAAWLVPGIYLSAAKGSSTPHDWLTLVIVALIFGVVNVIIRPIVLLLTLPLTILTLGLFTFVVNALMLILTSWIAEGMGLGFRVSGFWAGFLGALIVSVVSFVLNRLVTKRD
ncbi:MAG TPA: phage holin family protein [Candidatus Nitrosotalea sp.]|nr:phage holin family protein [Candidatus Nitrosotalea sp.]